MLYSLYHNKKLVGLFNDISICNTLIRSLNKQNFAKINDFYANEYIENSMLLIRKITFPYNNNKNENEYIDNKEFKMTKEIINKLKGTKEYSKIENERVEIGKKQKLLYKQKEKLQEMKNMFEVDEKLFQDFKKKISTDEKFEIPPLFKNKYKLLKHLDNDNNLNLENFMYYYDLDDDNENSYSKLFNSDNHENNNLEI
jgi:hypothetical protein